jgi:hypothetical protein
VAEWTLIDNREFARQRDLDRLAAATHPPPAPPEPEEPEMRPISPQSEGVDRPFEAPAEMSLGDHLRAIDDFPENINPDVERSSNDHRTDQTGPALHTAPGLHDMIDIWPNDIPQCLQDSPLSQPLSGLISDQQTADLPFVERFIYTVSLTLEAVGVPRDKTEYALKAMICVANMTLLKARRDFTDEQIINDSPAQTLKTVRKRMGIDLSTIAHPVCPNKDCQAVLYEITTMSTAAGALQGVEKCPKCGLDWAQPGSTRGPSTPAVFPTLPLTSEIERLLAYPGVEELAFNWRERDEVDTQLAKHDYPDLQIYRDQTDGSYLHSLLDPDGNRVDQGPFEGVKEIFVNLSLDWLNINSSSHGPGYSVGPILLQMGNLPQSMRGLQAMVMCCGLTPGKLC